MSPDLPVPAGMLIAMRETARLAGFFAAHGIWGIADGGTLTPLLGYEQTDGGRGMERFAADDIAGAARPARTRCRPTGAVRSARCWSPTHTFGSARAGPMR